MRIKFFNVDYLLWLYTFLLENNRDMIKTQEKGQKSIEHHSWIAEYSRQKVDLPSKKDKNMSIFLISPALYLQHLSNICSYFCCFAKHTIPQVMEVKLTLNAIIFYNLPFIATSLHNNLCFYVLIKKCGDNPLDILSEILFCTIWKKNKLKKSW